jgi:CubicO group peptidase (beta-lactamase class C family)
VGTKFQYSNLGFLLLSEIVAKVAKKPFDKYFEQNKVFAGLKSVGFNPSQTEWYNIAPTEYDSGKMRII